MPVTAPRPHVLRFVPGTDVKGSKCMTAYITQAGGAAARGSGRETGVEGIRDRREASAPAVRRQAAQAAGKSSMRGWCDHSVRGRPG